MKGKCEGVKYDPEDVNLTSKNYATTCWNKKKKNSNNKLQETLWGKFCALTEKCKWKYLVQC